MRTNIDIDDTLMAEAFAATGASTKRELVAEGLRALVRLKRQARIRSFLFFGSILASRPSTTSLGTRSRSRWSERSALAGLRNTAVPPTDAPGAHPMGPGSGWRSLP